MPLGAGLPPYIHIYIYIYIYIFVSDWTGWTILFFSRPSDATWGGSPPEPRGHLLALPALLALLAGYLADPHISNIYIYIYIVFVLYIYNYIQQTLGCHLGRVIYPLHTKHTITIHITYM